jgi:PPOX class probable F420-dependent enzyme
VALPHEVAAQQIQTSVEFYMAKLTTGQRQLFEDKNFVAVATKAKDGAPRNTIVWCHTDGDKILLNGARSRAWVKNLQRDPGVALTIFDREQPYRRVTVIGKAVEITTNGAEESIDMLSLKYGGQLYPNHLPDDPRIIVRIEPQKITTMNVE